MKHWYTAAPEKPQTKQFNILPSTTQVMSRVGNLTSNMERCKRQPRGADEKPRKCMLTRLWGQHLMSVQDKTTFMSHHIMMTETAERANSLPSDFAVQKKIKEEKTNARGRDQRVTQACSTSATGAGDTDLASNEDSSFTLSFHRWEHCGSHIYVTLKWKLYPLFTWVQLYPHFMICDCIIR